MSMNTREESLCSANECTGEVRCANSDGATDDWSAMGMHIETNRNGFVEGSIRNDMSVDTGAGAGISVDVMCRYPCRCKYWHDFPSDYG